MQNILRLLTLTILAFFPLVTFVDQGRADELKNIFQSASQMPSLLKSYQFSFTLRGGASDPPQYQEVDVWQSGCNIKTINTWIFPDGAEVDTILGPLEYAYNGVDYQWFATTVSNLEFSKKCRHPTPYWTPSPLIYPYFWVAELQANWSDIKDLAKWEAKFKGAKYVGQKIEDGIHFEVVSFVCPQMEVDRVHVYFAKDVHYYPLKFFGYIDGMNNGLPVARVQVTRYKTFDIDGMPFVFPLGVEACIGEGDGLGEEPLEMYWTVDESSIKINPQLDADMFTISPSRAKTITDYDKMLDEGLWLPSEDIADDGRDIVREPLPTRTWNTQKTLTVVIVNLVVIAILIYLLLRRKK